MRVLNTHLTKSDFVSILKIDLFDLGESEKVTLVFYICKIYQMPRGNVQA